MGQRVKFSVSKPGCDRIHHLTEEDVRVILSRLPAEIWSRLRAIHFDDESVGARRLGYVTRGRREIALCALPPRVSLSRFLHRNQSPRQFGASRGCQWPPLAIRRFLLYHVFLHELGHLQVVDAAAKTNRRRFAGETKAERFAVHWCKRLWSEPFDHPDPIHNPPTQAEFGDDDPHLTELMRRAHDRPEDRELLQIAQADAHYRKAVEVEPSDRLARQKLRSWRQRSAAEATLKL
jgi:hypothetical protein